MAFLRVGGRLDYACPGSGITFSCGATTVPRSKSCGVGVIVRLYQALGGGWVPEQDAAGITGDLQPEE